MISTSHSKLSVCLIVKNEASYLDDCLQSIAPVANQIIVVDTGSTDSTLSIAEAHGADIFHFDWCDDFAAARNYSIQQATNDWILWIDADERLQVESIPVLRKLLVHEQKPVIYRVPIRNIKAVGSHCSLSDAHRLFTNGRGICFEGRIHEQISPSARKVGAQERSADIKLDHLGYSHTGALKEAKQSRNRKLLVMELKQHPRSAYLHYTLAHNYKEAGELKQAAVHYQTALDLHQLEPRMEASLLNALADTLLELGNYDEAAGLIKRSLAQFERQYAAYYLQYRLARLQQDVPAAISCLKSLIDQQRSLTTQGSDLSTDIEIKVDLLWRTLGDLYAGQKVWPEAAIAYEQSLKNYAGDAALLKNYFRVLEKLQSWDKAIEILGQIIQLEGEQPGLLQALATLLLRLNNYELALEVYLRLNTIQPEQSAIRRQIAGLYAKLGQVEVSLTWLEESPKA